MLYIRQAGYALSCVSHCHSVKIRCSTCVILVVGSKCTVKFSQKFKSRTFFLPHLMCIAIAYVCQTLYFFDTHLHFSVSQGQFSTQFYMHFMDVKINKNIKLHKNVYADGFEHFKMLLCWNRECKSPLCFLFLDIERLYCLRYDDFCQMLRMNFKDSIFGTTSEQPSIWTLNALSFLSRFRFILNSHLSYESTIDKFHRQDSSSDSNYHAWWVDLSLKCI